MGLRFVFFLEGLDKIYKNFISQGLFKLLDKPPLLFFSLFFGSQFLASFCPYGFQLNRFQNVNKTIISSGVFFHKKKLILCFITSRSKLVAC